MNRHFLKFIISFLGFIFLFSCTSYDTRKHLDDIESYIMERPDSALAVLDSMDRSLLTTDQLRAHHALLHAMALDKNYIDVSDDSIARVAVDYYTRKGPDKYEARALYYLGVAYYYQRSYDKAILEFTKAEKVALKSDSLYCGMSKLIQSSVYNATYNKIEELKCIEKALNIFNEISADYYSQVSKFRLSQAFYNNKELGKSEDILLELITDEKINNKIQQSAKLNYAFVKAVKYNDYKAASTLYSQLYQYNGASYMTNKDYWVWAYSLSKVGNKEVSQNIVNQLKNDTSATAYYWQYKIAKSDGRIDDALSFLEKSSTKNNYEVEEALKQSLSSVQRDFYISQSELSEYKAQNSRLALIVIIIASVLLILFILWGLFIYIRRREEEKEYYLKYADEIHKQLEDARNENYPDLKRKYLSLYHSRFETIGTLYEQYSLFHGKKNEEKVIYDKVVALVDEFRNDYQDVEMFETVLNKDLDNIIADLRSDMPDFKETDFAIFRFLLIGFDVTVISHLLNLSMNAVYIRKSRMRHQIENTNPARKDEYIGVLDLKSSFYQKS